MSAVEQWLTPDEVAEQLKLHRGSVYRLISTGVLPAVRIDRALRVSRVELDEWLRSEPEQAA
jgi:putative molybdopterin biosynthesis protein